MTRARTASYGVVTPPPQKLLLQAVLMLCVSLVQGVTTTLGMIFKRTHHDWHTDRTHEDLPQATYANHLKEHTNTHRVILGLAPRISGGPSRGPAVDPLETHNRESRHKAQNDSFAGPTIQAPSLSFRTHAQRAIRNPGAAHNPWRTQLLGSRSRLPASGMTTSVCGNSARPWLVAPAHPTPLPDGGDRARASEILPKPDRTKQSAFLRHRKRIAAVGELPTQLDIEEGRPVEIPRQRHRPARRRLL